MKKWVKCLGISLLIASTLTISGCNEEKKYNEAKNAVQPMMQECLRTDFDLSSKETFAKSMEEHNKKKAEIDKKLKEMEELAKSDVKLNNDFQAFKKEFEDKDANIVTLEKGTFERKQSFKDKPFKVGQPW